MISAKLLTLYIMALYSTVNEVILLDEHKKHKVKANYTKHHQKKLFISKNIPAAAPRAHVAHDTQ